MGDKRAIGGVVKERQTGIKITSDGRSLQAPVGPMVCADLNEFFCHGLGSPVKHSEFALVESWASNCRTSFVKRSVNTVAPVGAK